MLDSFAQDIWDWITINKTTTIVKTYTSEIGTEEQANAGLDTSKLKILDRYIEVLVKLYKDCQIKIDKELNKKFFNLNKNNAFSKEIK